jgi:hypothetical protein
MNRSQKNNFLFKILPALLLFCFFYSRPLNVFSQKIKRYDLIKDFNAKADNKSDNYTAFINAAKKLSQAGGGILNIPKGKYYIAAYKIVGGQMKNTITDIIFKNCKNLTIVGNNSIIRVNGKFIRGSDYQLAGVPYHYAYNNTVCPFRLTNCSNVLIKDLSLYGEVDKMQREPGVVEGQDYGIAVWDEDATQMSSNIVLQNIKSHHFAADGFVIRSNGENIVLNNCMSYNNARQGLSIVKGRNIKCLNSSFDSTGITGKYGVHAPGAGIDIENEFAVGDLANVLIRNCNLRGNHGFQIVSTLAADSVFIDSCFISDLTSGYSSALNGVGMYSMNSTLSNCILFASIQVDISDQIYKGPKVQQINKNIIYSGSRGIVSADFARPVNITDNIFIMLPKPQLNTYFPYIQNPNCTFNRNIVVVHADRIKKTPNQVTALVQYAKEAMDDFWLVNGYDIPLEKQKENYFIPTTEGTKMVKDHFFGASNAVARYNYSKTHFLTIQQVNTILTKELFTAYKQNLFNKKYLLQADEVRKYTASIVSNAQ